MARMRSPTYPSINLEQAIDLVRKIHEHNRTNAIPRESAAKDMGYSGLTGRSLTLLGALAHYNLVQRAGKGDLKVTPTTVSILHGLTDGERREALLDAGHSPRLFQQLFERFPDGTPSENVIRSYLIQQGYADVAVGPAIKSFIETNRFLENAGVFDSHGRDAPEESDTELSEAVAVPLSAPVAPTPPPPPPPSQLGGYRIMESERVVFSEETGDDQYLKLVASGPLDDSLLEALEDYIRRQRKRLGVGG